MNIWSPADVLDSKQYQLQLCQDGERRRFFRLVPVNHRPDVASDVEVVAVTNVVPNALLKKRDLIAIGDEVTLVSGEGFVVDAHGIWFTEAEFRQLTHDGNVAWSTSFPPRLPDR